MNKPNSHQQLKFNLALYYARGIGPHKYRAISNAFSDLKEFFALSVADLIQLGLSQDTRYDIQNPNWHKIDEAINWALQPNQTIMCLGDQQYPGSLAHIADAPPVLFLQGDITLLSQPQIAIVGTRNPSYHGQETAYRFADQLAQHGLVITSGLAAGIDGKCHEGALKNNGKTIAVLGSGLNIIYPRHHYRLSCEIAAKGLLVSEFSPDTPPHPTHFPRRNRIISGLSLGVLVIEAALKSGSLITAKYAMEQGREVFAIPSSIHSPLSKGCHVLIRQGAKLVDSVEDILEELPGVWPIVLPKPALPANEGPLDLEQQQVFNCIGNVPVSINLLSQYCKIPVEKISTVALKLELMNLISLQPAGYVRVIS